MIDYRARNQGIGDHYQERIERCVGTVHTRQEVFPNRQ